jgi:putative membrane protein
VATQAFLGAAARAQATAAVRQVELGTSAELVVCARHASGSYRHADWLAGSLLAFAALCVLLFTPQAFAVRTMPLDVTVMWALGAAASSRSPWLRRMLTSARQLRENVRTAARAAFFTAGVATTSGRTGVLVYVSLLERSVEVVHDVGIDPNRLGQRWASALGELERAVAAGDFEKLVAGLLALGGPLADALPRRAHDVNELPDEVAP